MSKKAMGKNLRMSIWRSLGRYLAIVAIIALGASMFVGLLMTKTDMVATGQQYIDSQNMFDFRLISTYGWDEENLRQIAQLDGVAQAEGLVYQDLVVRAGSSESDSVYRFYAIPEHMNLLTLDGGRYPQAANECLADGFHMDDSILGTTITVTQDNTAESLEALRQKTFTVVGYVSTPLYMDLNRGSTTVGNGSLSGFVFVPGEVFDTDYYAEIHIRLPGTYEIYSEKYDSALDAAKLALEPKLLPIAQSRYDVIRQQALESYDQGLREYEQGLKEFEEGKAEAQRELADAEASLLVAQATIAAGEQLIWENEKKLSEGKKALEDGEKALQEGKEQLRILKNIAIGPLNVRKQWLENRYASAKEALDSIDAELAGSTAQLEALNAQIAQKEGQLNDFNSRISQLDDLIRSLQWQIRSVERELAWLKLLPSVNADKIAQQEANLASLQAQYNDALSQRQALIAQRDPLAQELQPSLEHRRQLEGTIAQIRLRRGIAQQSMDAVVADQQGLEAAWALTEAGFADTEEELWTAEAQLTQARQELEQGERELQNGKAALAQGKTDLANGLAEYESGKAEAEAQIAQGQAQLDEAKRQLDKAHREINDLDQAEVFLMDRRANVGYNSLDSSSDIVSGVSRVFPAFFLLVAALVCITTMTRMIDEERTQIGTLKALGYSNFAIINKYLLYAGSGAILGCGMGVILGSIVFPVILWEAYRILMNIPGGIVITFNWRLIAAVVGAYTLVMLLVTWWCCRRALREQPAELIRPKSPDAGKKILMEYLPFWKRISFLNKVTIRNIFRYRQRLAMMLVGIGGCTALLLTGFGLRDSIVNVVNYQFREVTTYDMTVFFSGGQSQENQEVFLEDVQGQAEDAMFYHQSNVELAFDNHTKEIYLIGAGAGIEKFINLSSGGEKLKYPGVDEVVLTVGTAEALEISVGDRLILRNADMQALELTVSGIYDNHVYNYAIVSPETIEKQWGQPPEMQMAFLTVKDGMDVHEVSANIGKMYNVLNVSVSRDLAEMVGKMMDALDLVVIVIVVCAGALAVIVLYNLTNININERIREIATIKVLGFDARETALYVFKENLSLTVIGSLAGLGLGYLLLLFVMSQIRIDMVWFKALTMPMSYVWAIILTILSALLVDLIFYFKLEKINMAEALKSVE